MTFRRHRDDADAPAEPLVPSEPLLELRGITAAYGRIQVLHGVDLAVPEGSVFALLGPNGAGKTTTLRVASGLNRPATMRSVVVLPAPLGPSRA